MKTKQNSTATTDEPKTVDHWLEKVCKYENKGDHKKAQMAFNAALRQE